MAELKIGLVGTGAIGRTHIERINTRLQGGRVVACADVNKDFGKSVAEKFGIRAFDTPEELINDSEIEAVIVTAADAWHAPFVLEAIKAGKPVFCEKPRPPLPSSAKRSWKRKSQAESTWCRSALCAAMTPVMFSSKR